jgi:hypothetical protein
LHVAVKILMLTDRNEIDDVPLNVDGICHEPLVILCLEFFHPDLTQRPSLAVSPMGILEYLRLDFVEPVNDCRREPLAIFVVAWSSEPCVWQLPPAPLDGLGKSCLDLSRPLQDLPNEPKGKIWIVLGDHGQFDVSAGLFAQWPMLPFSARRELALQVVVHPKIQRHHRCPLTRSNKS